MKRTYSNLSQPLPGTAVDVDASLGCLCPAIGMQFIFIPIQSYGYILAMGITCHGRSRIPTSGSSIGRSRDEVILEFQIVVKNSRVQLYLSKEALADFLPVGCWVGHPLDFDSPKETHSRTWKGGRRLLR